MQNIVLKQRPKLSSILTLTTVLYTFSTKCEQNSIIIANTINSLLSPPGALLISSTLKGLIKVRKLTRERGLNIFLKYGKFSEVHFIENCCLLSVIKLTKTTFFKLI